MTISVCTGALFLVTNACSQPELVESPYGNSRILAVCGVIDGQADRSEISARYAAIDWMGYAERDLQIVEVRDRKTIERVDSSFTHMAVGDPNRAIYRAARCQADYEIVLIGKDGTQKRRWSELPSSDTLFTLIDAMPMRRFEMRQKQRRN